jgi:hypothetical protein
MGKMNLTMAELKERPGLVAAVVAYHGARQYVSKQAQRQQQHCHKQQQQRLTL